MRTSEETVSLEDTGWAALVSVFAKEPIMTKCTFPNLDFIPSAAAGGEVGLGVCCRPLRTAFMSLIGLAQQSVLRSTFSNFDLFLSDDYPQI